MKKGGLAKKAADNIEFKDLIKHLDKVDLETVMTQLDDMIYTQYRENNSFDSIQQLDINNKGGAKVKLNLAKFLTKYVREKITGRQLARKTYARRYFNFVSTMLYTMLDRYSKSTIGSNNPYGDTVKCLNDFAEKFCRDYSHLADKYIRVNHKIGDTIYTEASPKLLGLLAHVQMTSNPDLINYHYYEYMKSLQQKGLKRDQFDVEFDEWFRTIDFFSKKQAKPDVRHFFEQRVKAGQGVAAWQKHINALFAPYSRCTAQMLHNILLPNVFLASNRPDSEIGVDIAQKLDEFVKQYDIKMDLLANDFAEFDSTQYMMSPILNSVFMLHLGAPPLLVDVYLNMRQHWTLSNDIAKIHGHEKMHSGEPFTLVGNTLFCMVIIAHCIDFDELCFGVFKGDDSGLGGINLRFNNNVLQFAKKRGLIMKADYPPFLEFAGSLITPYGYYPDVIRKTVKFLSTIYRDNKHYDDSIRNLVADLQCIQSVEHMICGSNALADYYNWLDKTTKITPSFVHQCLSFLYYQTTVKYDTLLSVNSEMLTYLHGIEKSCNNVVYVGY